METNKQYKRVPFEIELAKKIQSGEVEGRIVTLLDNVEMEILTFNSFDKEYPIIARYKDIEEMGVELFEYHIDGKTNPDGISFWFDLNIELPEETPKHEFKPFDKVLVRHPDKTELCVSNSIWIPGIFQYKSVNSNLYFVSGKAYKDCIPYEGNEHLIGTTDNIEY